MFKYSLRLVTSHSLPWLEDNEDVTKFPPERLGYFLQGSNKNSVAFQVGVIFGLWALTPLVLAYATLFCCLFETR